MRKLYLNALSVPALTLLLCPLFCLPGNAAPQKKVKQTAAPLVRMGVVERDVKADIPDPKHPGKLLCHLDAATAGGQSANNGFLGTMTQVQARLYHLGKPAATLAAPRTEGNQVNKALSLTASGGVVIHSLTQPGTTLTADQVVWHANTNQIVATGHVVYRDGKTGAILTGPVLTGDTKLQAFSFKSGVHGHLSF